jgi:anti-sigma factor ChrR (cupin superfamily)
MAAEASIPSQLIDVAEVEWQPMMPLIKAKLLWSDPASKRRAQLTRFEPGAVLPMHKHVGDEFLYVIEGEISDESGPVRAGSVGYRPDGCIHSVTSKHGATVFAIIAGGVEAANAIGDAPRSQTIVLSEIPWSEALPGVKQKPIWSDPSTKRRAILARFDAGAKLPLHKHIGDEVVFMIEGSNFDESGEVRTGNANYRPNGCTHTVSSKYGGTAIAFVTGGVEMIKQ